MGITGNIGLEADALVKALLTGAALGMYYDLFRILRRVFRFGYAMIIGQDLLFWITASVGIFFSSVVVYGGQLRILFVLAAFAGWGLYAASFGSLLISIVDSSLGVLRRAFKAIYRIAFQPVIGLLKSALNQVRRTLGTLKFRFIAKSRKKSGKTEKNEENTA